ncbi:MAG: GGDEF domain-containing protein [Chloroflexaceae bacterium]|nr:GGDEF domain-containing protein [Chloroflexaceae bacterium]
MVCRYGGEEFTLVLPEASLEDTLARAEEIRRNVHTIVVEYEGQMIQNISVSVGVASFPDHGIAVDAVLRTADQALYQAKRNGRNCVVLADVNVAM